jgi:hypothetical protein
VIEAAPLMFEGYPKYSTAAAAALSEMPRIKALDDWKAMTTRPRLIMEDPRQLLSGCVTDYVTEQLWRQNNQPEKVTVPASTALSIRVSPDGRVFRVIAPPPQPNAATGQRGHRT